MDTPKPVLAQLTNEERAALALVENTGRNVAVYALAAYVTAKDTRRYTPEDVGAYAREVTGDVQVGDLVMSWLIDDSDRQDVSKVALTFVDSVRSIGRAWTAEELNEGVEFAARRWHKAMDESASARESLGEAWVTYLNDRAAQA